MNIIFLYIVFDWNVIGKCTSVSEHYILNLKTILLSHLHIYGTGVFAGLNLFNLCLCVLINNLLRSAERD